MSGIFINVDAQTFWHNSGNMNREGVIRDVDFYTKNGGVEAVFYNMNFQRAYFDSRVFTPLWKDCAVGEDGSFLFHGKKYASGPKDQLENLLLMRKNCPDFMQVRYDRCHENGAEMWNSMRMNDVHYTQLGSEHSPQHGDLWRTRKDLLRAWYRHKWRGIWTDNCFDYAQKEVYDCHLAFARELMMNFESDGIELDWLRAAPVFRPGFDEINAPILTQFLRDIRKVCDEAAAKWGHRMRVSVRTPYRVDETLGLGMEIGQWCREGLVNVVTPGPNSVVSEIDQQLSIWKQILPPDVIFAPGIDWYVVSRDEGVSLSEATDSGFASAFYEMGADTLYFYNHFPTTQPEFPRMSEFFGCAGDRAAVAAKERRQIAVRHEPVGEGTWRMPPMHPHEIWAESADGATKINVGENVADREAVVVLGFDRPVEVDVLVNTEKCALLPADTPLTDKYPAKIPFWIQAKIPDGVLHDGWNEVELFNRMRQSIFGKEIAWMEIRIAAAE